MNALHKNGVSVDVGARLKALRHDRKVSMRTLAKQSGLSANALSMIERGLTSPSVSTLSKLAGALEVPITAFFRQLPDQKKVVLSQEGERIQLRQICASWESLGSEKFTGPIDAYKLAMDEGGSSGPYPITHSGSEFIYVSSGQLQCVIDEQIYPLKAGDSLLFEACLGHSWSNPGPGAAVAIILSAAFEADERPAEYHLSPGS